MGQILARNNCQLNSIPEGDCGVAASVVEQEGVADAQQVEQLVERVVKQLGHGGFLRRGQRRVRRNGRNRRRIMYVTFNFHLSRQVQSLNKE